MISVCSILLRLSRLAKRIRFTILTRSSFFRSSPSSASRRSSFLNSVGSSCSMEGSGYFFRNLLLVSRINLTPLKKKPQIGKTY